MRARPGATLRMPTGTVTFLFTDIEGSTRLWEAHSESMREALARHDVLVRDAIVANDGVIFKTMGDAFCAAFASSGAAVAAAVAAQRAILGERWPDQTQIRVRMAVHTGAVESRGGDYFGQPLNRVARLLAAGHGGQVLLSLAAQELARDALPAGVTLQDMGERRLKDLIRPERIFQLVAPGLPAEFPPLRTLDVRRHGLPIQLTSFVGREREMQQVRALLRSSRLVTLTGTGGAGKTRLAMQVGADCIDEFPDGAWLVELAPLSDAALVAQSVAAVLGVKEAPGVPVATTLVRELEDRQLLVILDNCEHLVEAAARLCETLLAHCAGVRILATSREALRSPGEVGYRVPSLAAPDPGSNREVESLTQYAAVQLFIDRAVAAHSTFRVDNVNAPAVASLCFHLDGIPLAIELAAARVKSMTADEINERLGQRFRLLTGGSRTALPRHQTLRALIDWSYDLLSDPERDLFARLSIFAGGWTLRAAEQVCGGSGVSGESIVGLLASLADKSLLQVEEREGATRYRLLETVRQYARDRLLEMGEDASWRNRHLAYFAAWADDVYPRLGSADQPRLIEQLEAEHDNLRAALAWSSGEGGDGEVGLRLASKLHFFWLVRGYLNEGRNWLAGLLAGAAGDPAIRARALGGEGALARLQGDYAAARSLYEQSLAIHRDLGDLRGIADSLSNLGLVGFHRGEYTSALSSLEEAVAIQRELGDRHAMAFSLNVMGMVTMAQADYPRARRLLEESLAIRRETGNRHGMAATLNNLGNLATCQGDYARARTLHEEGLAIRRQLGDKRGIAAALINLGHLDLETDASASAREVFEQCLAIFRELGDRYGIGESLANLGRDAARQGDLASARGFLEQSLAVCREAGDGLGVAKSLGSLGIVTAELGDYRTARAHLADAVKRLRELDDRLTVARTLRALARVACVLYGPLHAARVWGGAERLQSDINVPIVPGDRPDYERQIAAARGALGDDAAFDAAWREGRAMTLDETIARALAEPGASRAGGDAGM